MTVYYIDKCIKYKKAIDSFLSGVKPLLGFDIGDNFHHQTLMDPGAYKEVKEIKSDMYIYAEDPTEKYPICECVLLPKEEELKAGAEKNGIDVDDYKPGIGVEALLDRLVKLPEFKKRFLGVVCFTGGTDV